MVIPFNEAHVGDVAEIERLCFSEPWSEKALAESLASEFSHFLVFAENGRVQGYIGLYAVAGEGSITNVATHPEFRKRGIGKALVGACIDNGRALGLEYITLEVRESNLDARHLYEKCGFESVGRRKGFYSLPKEDAIIMNYFYKD